MNGEEMWLIKSRENYNLICQLNKNTVSTNNLTGFNFWHQNDTREITKFILRSACQPSFSICFPPPYEACIFFGRSIGGVSGLEKGG